ncbi:hypothetical protein [uncultured Methanoregula sp.]|uniref:hypothetical protein n=1 Tax=uncultured Methanoregula sp. TaxID=1005933 RepID=UPI002AABC03C|nr:hypothetical protein [uncultured Methanoregula sp.]
MDITRDQERVLKNIFTLSAGKTAIPVTIGAIHGSFSDMDVRDLVGHLDTLLTNGLIENARPAKERISTMLKITPEGIRHCTRDP